MNHDTGDAVESCDDIRSRHEVYAQEIEGLDDHWGSTLRAVYERGEQQAFIEYLNNRLGDHDRTIERMCSQNYQSFISSIRQLLEVRADADRLKNEVVHVDERLVDTCQQLVRRGDALVRARRVKLNIQRGMAALRNCLPLLSTSNLLNRQMSAGRHYQALRTLERLESLLVPPVAGYRFAQIISENAARVRNEIRHTSMSLLKDFLEQARLQAPVVGAAAMKQADVSYTHDQDHNQQKIFGNSSDEEDSSESSDDSKSRQSRNEVVVDESPVTLTSVNDCHENLSGNINDRTPTDAIDFVPLYRCWHIHRTLGESEDFRRYYRMQRVKQARLASDPSLLVSTYNSDDIVPSASTMSGQPSASAPNSTAATNGLAEADLDALLIFLHGLAGFFMIERHVFMHAGYQLVETQQLQQLWSENLSNVVQHLRVQLPTPKYLSQLLAVKRQLVVFCQAMASCSFDMQPLQQLLLSSRQLYNDLLTRRCEAALLEIFDDDNYHPIELPPEDNSTQHDPVVKAFPFSTYTSTISLSGSTCSGDVETLPRRLPFSLMVPRVYQQLVLFIRRCARFSVGLGLTAGENDEWLRRSLNGLLTHSLANCVSRVIHRPALGLLQLIQISINTAYLETASQHLENVIAEITGYNRKQDDGVQSGLVGRSTFKDIRSDTEQHIYTQLQAKIDEFIELAAYDWHLFEPAGAASSYMLDLVYFLRTTFCAFTNLPPAVAQTACMSGCQHVARRLLGLLTSSVSGSAISVGALQQLSLDVLQCEQFAASDPVVGFEDGALLLCFAELRQLLDLIIDSDWQRYYSEYGQPTGRYCRVTPSLAAAVVDKVREAERRNVFTVLKKAERDRRKLHDSVLKQLRQLEVDGSGDNSNNARLD